MNKQESIEKYENILKKSVPFTVVNIHGVLRDLKQLDEPQKVVVPQFVADWYEEHKDNLEFYIFDYVYRFDQQKNSDFKDWLDGFKTGALQTLVNMHQFGYEVEKEPKYTVMVKGVTGYGRYLNKISKKYCFASENEAYGYTTKHTRKQLEEAGFGWVFDCEGIEVQEVE
nr:MAG TPA: Protein of unknown function (DUF1642) [Caudoviricetes sp.]